MSHGRQPQLKYGYLCSGCRSGGYKLLPEDLLVNSDIGIANQASPSITSGQGDDAVLVWSDGRSGTMRWRSAYRSMG
jgi:hypothetical protein